MSEPGQEARPPAPAVHPSSPIVLGFYTAPLEGAHLSKAILSELIWHESLIQHLIQNWEDTTPDAVLTKINFIYSQLSFIKRKYHLELF